MIQIKEMKTLPNVLFLYSYNFFVQVSFFPILFVVVKSNKI